MTLGHQEGAVNELTCNKAVLLKLSTSAKASAKIQIKGPPAERLEVLQGNPQYSNKQYLQDGTYTANLHTRFDIRRHPLHRGYPTTEPVMHDIGCVPTNGSMNSRPEPADLARALRWSVCSANHDHPLLERGSEFIHVPNNQVPWCDSLLDIRGGESEIGYGSKMDLPAGCYPVTARYYANGIYIPNLRARSRQETKVFFLFENEPSTPKQRQRLLLLAGFQIGNDKERSCTKM